MKKYKIFYLLAFIIFIFQGCTEDITLDMPAGEEKIVVEGNIENGQPPFVVLTKTVPYFSETSVESLNNSYVTGADVKVSDGTTTFDLLEVNLASLPDSIRQMISVMLGIDLGDFSGFNYVFYTSLDVLGEVGKNYELTVDYKQHHLHAVTQILPPVPIDSLWYELPPDADNDSFYILKTEFFDPPATANYYRYFTQRNEEPFYTNVFSSVFDDQLVDGKKISTPVTRGQSRNASFEEGHFGLFSRGDTVTLKLSSIDDNFYDFWLTFENDQLRGGPFASPVLIKNNIEG